jgi:CheY-like chemotaxis protein
LLPPSNTEFLSITGICYNPYLVFSPSFVIIRQLNRYDTATIRIAEKRIPNRIFEPCFRRSEPCWTPGKKDKTMTHILVIDDEKPIRLMLRKLLESQGYTVTDASDGTEGLKRYQEHPADLIITDIIMPDKEGIETIIALKKQNPDIKIIAMSGGGKNKPDRYLQTAKLLGAKETFEKPIRKEKLLQAIQNLIQHHS